MSSESVSIVLVELTVQVVSAAMLRWNRHVFWDVAEMEPSCLLGRNAVLTGDRFMGFRSTVVEHV